MKRSSQPTINDVARIAGVSKKTVSRVINQSPLLNGDTRRRVEEVIADLGYVPNPQARALALRRNFLIGLIHDNPNAQMVLNVQQGMAAAAAGVRSSVEPTSRPSRLTGCRASRRAFIAMPSTSGPSTSPGSSTGWRPIRASIRSAASASTRSWMSR